jgi:hypothetical protein
MSMLLSSLPTIEPRPLANRHSYALRNDRFYQRHIGMPASPTSYVGISPGLTLKEGQCELVVV